jgi:AraC-like DNA-binding protein
MLSITTRTTTDADEFRGQIRPDNTEFLVTSKGPFSATVTKIDLIVLGMQSLTESHARTWHIALARPRIGILFSARQGPPMIYGGKEIAKDEVALITQNMDAWQQQPGSFQNASLSLPEETVEREMAAVFAQEPTPKWNRPWLSVPPETMTHLRHLHAAVLNVAETAPEILTNPGAAKGLESSLLDVFFNCLPAKNVRKDSLGRRAHWRVAKQLHALAEQHPDEPLFVADICKTLGVTERTLHHSCREQFGMGPKQYLTLRRLHLVRRALRRGPSGESVTDIATRFGFWELGRFAGVYQSIFGETPSTTLHTEQSMKAEPP